MYNEKEIAKRVEILKSLHEYFIEIGDEDLYTIWVECGVPNEPSEEDYNYIASNIKEFCECLSYANHILKIIYCI